MSRTVAAPSSRRVRFTSSVGAGLAEEPWGSRNESLDLPSTLRVVTGVTGNEIWPVNTDDVEMEEVGEVAALSDQVVNFANITPQQKRVGLKVPVSNMAFSGAGKGSG